MNTSNIRGFLAIILISVFACICVGCQQGASSSKGHDAEHHDHGAAEADDFPRGPHHGRLLKDGSFGLEVVIFEAGVPPLFRVYGFYDGKLISPSEFTANISLTRLGKDAERFEFKPIGDFLSSDAVVKEPHSFDVQVKAKYSGKEYSWSFSSYEGRTTIPQQVASQSGIKIEAAASRQITTSAHIRGKVVPSEHKIAHIIPRFPGVVKEGRKHIGDTVQKGEVVAIIESNESLQPFEVRSQISGTVINGHVIVGEFVPQNQWIYIVADLSEVWVDFFIPLRENLPLKLEQRLKLSSVDGVASAEGAVNYVAPYADERSQSQLVRAVIPNPDKKLLPGMFVTGDLIVAERQARVAVRRSALQRFRDWDVVFRRVGDTFEVAPLELGIQDDTWVEVLSGLDVGDDYASENSFVVKADILKSGASHDH